MHQDFIAEPPQLFFRKLRLERIGHDDLEVGPVPFDLERHQGGVIERRLMDAPQICRRAFRVAHRHRPLPVEFACQRKEPLDVAVLDHGEHGVAAAVEIGVQSLVERCKTALDGAEQEYVEVTLEARVSKRDHVAVGGNVAIQSIHFSAGTSLSWASRMMPVVPQA